MSWTDVPPAEYTTASPSDQITRVTMLLKLHQSEWPSLSQQDAELLGIALIAKGELSAAAKVFELHKLETRLKEVLDMQSELGAIQLPSIVHMETIKR